MLMLKSRRGTSRVKKVTSCTPCMSILIVRSTFLFPKTENDSAIQCSNEMRNSYTMEQSANTSELSNIFYTDCDQISLKSFGIPVIILICRKTQSASLETMQKITKQQYFLAVDLIICLIFLSKIAVRLMRNIWLMTMMRNMSRMVTDSRGGDLRYSAYGQACSDIIICMYY